MVVITDNRKKLCEFGELFIGDYFMYGDCLYVVTENTVSKENVCDKDVKNALNLGGNGLLACFHNEDLVEPVDIQITIS
jgi:hypothetical protein